MRVLFSILLLILLPWGALAQRPNLGKPYVQAPIVLDGRPIAEAWIFPREGEENFAVDAQTLLASVKPILKDDLYLKLKNSVRPNGTFTIRDIKAAGFSITFDEATVELRLDLPPKYRKPQDLTLNYFEFGEQKYQRPDSHSGYLNMRVIQGWQYGSNVEEKRRPLAGNLEFVENIKGFVLESSADYEEGGENEWHRQDTRLRFDDENNMVRYTLGDLTFRSTGFQQTPSIAGLSASREFAIQPYKTIKPLSDTEIVIKRPSIVEIYVNGFLYSQMRLAPGVFNIRDFPLTTGQSSVRIKVRDDLGQEEIYDFSMLYENSLLGKGIQEFSYAAGIPWVTSGGDRTYHDSETFVSLLNRYGFTDHFTGGLNFQKFAEKNLLGVELSGIANLGYLSLQVARGEQSPGQFGFAEKLTYRTLDKIMGRQMPFLLTLEAENQDADFYPVTVADVPMTDPNKYQHRYDAQLNYRFESSLLWGVGANLVEYHDQEDARTYRSNLMLPVGREFRVEMAYSKTVTATEEDRFLISLYWNESQGYFSASSYYDTENKTVNATVSRNNRYQYDDYRVSAAVQNNENGNTRSLAAEYLAQPLSVRLDHFNNAQFGQDSNITSIGLNTGFAWVGSHGAFTQPVSDSFVLINADNLPKDQSVLINPSGEKGQAQLGPRKTVVLKDQSAYYLNTVNVDATQLPLGYLLEKEYYGTQLTYRSGLLLDLDIKKRIMVKGSILEADGKPIAFAAGDIFDAKGQLIDNSFFTNKEGRFVIEGLSAGSYKIMTDQKDLPALEFTITPEMDKMLNLGPVQLKREGNR